MGHLDEQSTRKDDQADVVLTAREYKSNRVAIAFTGQ